MIKMRKLLMLITCLMLLVSVSATAEEQVFESGEDWFGEDFHYDITRVEENWDLLMKPITVLDIPQNEYYWPRKTPDGEKVLTDKLGGTINGSTAAVHVLGEDENGWTLIEGLDYHDRKFQGYVPTNMLKTVTPNPNFGIIVDKLDQTLYMFVDGKLFSSVPVSTGLVNDEQPYNETAAGEYLIASWVGGFDSEGMICDKAIRFNGGDLFHAVPYVKRADGTKSYRRYEAQLGRKASHGCIRVDYKASKEGLNQDWLWENLKRNTKVLVWDDDGRKLPYPDDDMKVYYNKTGGKNFHGDEYCRVVRDKYLPLSSFTYAELDTGIYADLTPCGSCAPPLRKAEIDEINFERGVISSEELARSQETQIEANRSIEADNADEQTETQDDEQSGEDSGLPEVVITIH